MSIFRKMGRAVFLIVSALMALSMIVGPSGAERRPAILHVNDHPILDLVGSVEGPAGYNDYYRGTPLKPDVPLSSMTFREVRAYQEKMVKAGSKSSAVGRYQFIRKTLAGLMRDHDIDPDAKFSPAMQDYLARILLRECDFYDRSESAVEIGNCLSRKWAALPVMTGSKKGRSYYYGIAGNRALLGVSEVLEVIRVRMDQDNATFRMVSGTARPASTPQPIVWPDDGKNADRIPLR